MVRRIGIALRFEAETVAEVVGLPCFAVNSVVHVIAGVELNAGFRGEDFENSASVCFVRFRGKNERFSTVINHKIVIVAEPELQLLVVVIDVS